MTDAAANEREIRALLDAWAAAVRARDLPAILAHHSPDLRMFDVPPPFESRGLDAYAHTWDLFYSVQHGPVAFEIDRLEIVAGDDVAFAVAHLHCADEDADGQPVPLDVRLTVGLRKVDARWTIVHEHHSVPTG